MAINAAIDVWDDDNRYYPGKIKVEIPAEIGETRFNQPIIKEFTTKGANVWDNINSFLNGMSLATGLLSLAALVIPGAQPLAIPLFWASVATGTAGAASSLVQRRFEGRFHGVADTLDILSIVSNILAGTWVLKTSARLVGEATQFSKGLVIGQLAADSATGIILNSIYAEKFQKIMALKDPQERTNQLIKLCQEAALNNALIAISIQGNLSDLRGLNGANTEVEIGVEFRPDEPTPPPTETPVNNPRVETPSTETPVNNPRIETPSTETPVNNPRIETPSTETPVNNPRIETPSTETPVNNPAVKQPPASVPDTPTIIAEEKIVNALGETHEFKVLSDGTVRRCSQPCMDTATNFGERLSKILLLPRAENQKIVDAAQKLSQRREAFWRESRALGEQEQLLEQATNLSPEQQNKLLQEVTDKQEKLLKDATQLEQEISTLEYHEILGKSKLTPGRGYPEQKESFESILDARELLNYDPLLREQYSQELNEISGDWKASSELALDASADKQGNLKAEFNELKVRLAALKDEVAPQILEPKLIELSNLELERAKIRREERPLYDEWISALNRQSNNAENLKSQYILKVKERLVLEEKLESSEQEIRAIELLAHGEQQPSIIERFSDNATVQDVLQKLTGDQTTSSFRP